MSTSQRKDIWAGGDAYEPYVGRWSRLVAREFLEWLNVAPESHWVDVGCGTGALSQTILNHTAPVRIRGVDRSQGYAEFARQQISDQRASFQVGNAGALPFQATICNAALSGLVLNFVAQPIRMVSEMARVTKAGGTVAAYVWDYAGQMQLMRYFWDAAAELDPAAIPLDEGRRFPICQPEPLAAIFREANLRDVAVRPIDVPTSFRDFDDYWSPFLGGQGPAPGYAMSLSEERRTALRERIRAALPIEADGRINLVARAWAVRGAV